MKSYEIGINAEKDALGILKDYEIVGQRIKTKFGEIDILAKKNNAFYIFEVKSRKTERDALESLNSKQIKRCIQAFFSYVQINNIEYEQIFIKLITVVKNKIKIIDIDILDFEE